MAHGRRARMRHPAGRRLSDGRSHGGLRRGFPGPRRLQLQRDGHSRRRRRRRGRRGRLPRRARAYRRRARRRQGDRHRRRLYGHGRLPHLGAQGRQRSHLPLPALAPGDAGPRHRGRRGRRRGRAARASRGAGAHPGRRRAQGDRHRDAAHGARRARRLGPAPAGAARGLRVRRRVRPGDRRHRPVSRSRRHERGTGRQAHQVEDRRSRRVHLPDRRPQGLCRRRRGAGRADRHPGRRAGQEGGLEHRRLLSRARHARGLARARRAARHTVLCRHELASRPRPGDHPHGRDPAGVHRHDDRRLAPGAAGRDAQARARRTQGRLPADRAGLLRARRAAWR